MEYTVDGKVFKYNQRVVVKGATVDNLKYGYVKGQSEVDGSLYIYFPGIRITGLGWRPRDLV